MAMRIVSLPARFRQSALAQRVSHGDVGPLCDAEFLTQKGSPSSRSGTQALDAHGISVERFMRALLAAQAVPFAVKPLTLNMLLAIYRQRGDLPDSNIVLYKQGCLALCEEQNKSRRDSGRRGKLNAGQRMCLSGRIAAATIVGNRFAVWTGLEVECP